MVLEIDARLVSAIDREFVTSAKKNSRILTNFPKLKKFVTIRTKIGQMPEWAWPSSGIVYLFALLATSQQQQLKNLMRFTVSC